MKLKPTQIVGVVAIIVFGGGMIFRMTQPSEREIMERRLASLPRISAPEVEFPMPDLSSLNTTVTAPTSVLGAGTPATPAEPEIDYTALGSQEAKDDLYCSGVLGAEFSVKIKTDHPDKVAPLLDMQKKLDSAGIAKLRAEGVSKGEDWAYYTLAFGKKAEGDYAASALRIPVATCVERASKLPPGDLY
jgi:hypothetical protein